MSDPTPPAPGTLLWGDDLNAYLLSLEARIATNEGRITALEAKPEHLFNSYPWQYSNQPPPPTGNQVRFDNADLSLATSAVFRILDSDGADRKPVFQALRAGSYLFINDWDDAAAIHRFSITGAAVLGATDATVPVSWYSGSGTIPNAKANVAFLVALSVVTPSGS
jgi:hypothetical protein